MVLGPGSSENNHLAIYICWYPVVVLMVVLLALWVEAFLVLVLGVFALW